MSSTSSSGYGVPGESEGAISELKRHLVCVDKGTGKIIWADSTTSRTYDTVNNVKGQPGGSIDGLGPAIAGGMVFTMSGFNGAANTGGNGVNVLLAYSVDGK